MKGRPALRRTLLTVWDFFSWAFAIVLASVVRYEFAMSSLLWAQMGIFLSICIGYFLLATLPFNVHNGRFWVGSFDEAIGLAVVTGFSGVAAAITLPVLPGDLGFSRGVAMITPVLAYVIMMAGRFFHRLYKYRGFHAGTRTDRVLIYGAGESGAQLIRLIFADKESQFRVVGIIDDNLTKQKLTIMNVPVVGTRADLAAQAEHLKATSVILAITTANGDFIGSLNDEVKALGLDFHTLPPIGQMIDGRVHIEDVKRVGIEDILGRHQVQTDLGAISKYISNKRVLVTGAGGSIGSELAAQVYKLGPSDLIMLDRDESALQETQLNIYGRGLLDTPDVVLCDIRDDDALREIFEQRRPEVVFHAAALKHLPMLEQYPDEGWKTNVQGSLNVLQLSREFDVEVLVNISTDKAADPTSVLGRTKRFAEQLTAWYAAETGRKWMSVRFGNVLGSRGSMLHAFNAMIDRGGPLTVTHPEITRYFMTINEACQLVIQSGAIGKPGEVLVLEMGEPVKILDVAKRMIAESGKRVEIQITGLRPGEKLHEDLFSDDEQGEIGEHDMISHVPVPPLDPAELKDGKLQQTSRNQVTKR